MICNDKETLSMSMQMWPSVDSLLAHSLCNFLHLSAPQTVVVVSISLSLSVFN